MPFQSEKQRRYLHANHPEIAKRWERDYANGGISNHFRKKYSLGEGPVMEETDNMDFLSSLTQEQVDEDPERYAQLLIGLRKPDFISGEHGSQRAFFIQPDNSRISVPWGWSYTGGGDDYFQTIEFKNGGILDINESEEIISDDGNDIELTAYNAEFDDPNDLSTGVKSLFMKKGGNVRLGPHTATDLLAKKNPDGTRSKYQPPGGGETSLGSGAAYSGGASDRGPRDDPDRFGPVSKPQTVPSGINIHGGPTVKEALDEGQRKRDIKNIIELRKEEKYDTWDQRFQDIPGTSKTNIYKSKVNVDYRRDIYEKALAKQKAKMKKWGILKAIPAGIVLAITQNPKWAMKTFSLGKSDMISIGKYSLPVMKAKKELIEALELHKEALLKDVDIFNPNEMVNLEETTDFTETMNEIKDLTKTKDEEDTKDDKGAEEVVPVHQEIEAYAQSDYYMSPWERMKANQAKRAMLVEKGIIQDNPIVDESVTDITMTANRGGLANLFRVKNQ